MASFDCIIIGAGIAGCVLADGLTASGNARVLLLEAGGQDDATQIKIPAASSQLYKSAYDWNYMSVPQAQGSRAVSIPRGRVLGGSSSINSMIYMRGSASDYDQWPAKFGARAGTRQSRIHAA